MQMEVLVHYLQSTKLNPRGLCDGTSNTSHGPCGSVIEGWIIIELFICFIVYF